MFRRKGQLKFVTKIVTIVLVLMLVPMLGFASTMCKQQYFLFGKGMGASSLITYVMQNTGECEWYLLRELYFSGDRLDSVRTIQNADFDDTFTSDRAMHLELAQRMFQREDGGFSRENMSTGVYTTRPDSTKIVQIDSILTVLSRGELDPNQWHRKANAYGKDSLYFVQKPDVQWVDSLELVYYDPQGLYIDYEIRDVVYWPNSRLIWIETKQPRQLPSGDGLHGVLIYRLPLMH